MLHRNLSLKAAAFALAVFLWFWVLTNQRNPMVSDNVMADVRVQDIAAGLALERAPESVRVSLRGSRQDMADIGRRVQAYVSAAGLGPGRHALPVKVQAPDSTTVVSVTPSAQSISLEPLVTQVKTVEVKLVGELPVGYEFLRADSTPRYVHLSGPKSRVDQVMRVVATVDLQRVVPEIPVAVPVAAVDEVGARVDGVATSPQQINVRVQTKREVASRMVPVMVPTSGSLPDGLRMTSVEVKPPMVAIFGSTGSVAGVSYVTTKPLALDDITGSVIRTLDLVVPDGLQVVASAQVTVRVKVARELPIVPVGQQ
jgi:YbbR domain-containing protein